MGQEFQIKSANLEAKVRELLPSQGGFGAGVDLSASTQIIPIVDLTESAEGSNLRSDLQRAFSLDTATTFAINNSSGTIISNTGYFRILGTAYVAGSGSSSISLTDGVTTKTLLSFAGGTGFTDNYPVDLTVFVDAGHSVTGSASSTSTSLTLVSRQIATIDGTLVNP